MIGALRGVLADKIDTGELLVDCGGVGYRVLAPLGVAADLGPVGSQITVSVHTHVREDAIVLYGFASRVQRSCFEALLDAHGVGPSLALSVLSVLSPDELCMAVADDDLDALTTVPGIGRKTAARLVLDLKSRLASLTATIDRGSWSAAAAGDPPGHAAGQAHARNGARRSHAEVRAALCELGFSNEEARDATRDLPVDGSPEELLRVALRSAGAVR